MPVIGYLVAVFFFAACAALYVLRALLIDFRQAEARCVQRSPVEWPDR
jgi:hypothetical protein